MENCGIIDILWIYRNIGEYLWPICINLKTRIKFVILLHLHLFLNVKMQYVMPINLRESFIFCVDGELVLISFKTIFSKALKFQRFFSVLKLRSIHRLLNNYLNLNKIIKIFRICMNLIYPNEDRTQSERTRNNRNNSETQNLFWLPRNSENGQQDGYQETTWWRQKTKPSRDFIRARLKWKNCWEISAWLCNYFMMFTTVLKSLKVKPTTATSFPISSLTPDGKIKFYVVEKIENYSRNFSCQFSFFLMSLNIITQSPPLFRRINEKGRKNPPDKEGKRLHKIWIKLQ